MNAILCRSCTEHEEKTVLLPVNSTVRGSLRRGRPWLDRLRLTNAGTEKTDRNDARGIAQMMRVGVYRPGHVKTLRSQKLRMLLTHPKLLQSKAIPIENDLRATLRNFGLKVGMVGMVGFEARIQALVATIPDLAMLVEPLLVVRRALREQIVILHRRLLAIVRDDEVCRRLMTTPGVGPVVALTLSCYRRCASPIPKVQVG